jgi:hypothetical protein
MDKLLDNLTHLVRDIFFYFIPGAIIIFLPRDHSFIHSYESFGKNFKFESSYFLIIMCYVFGHIISVIANFFDCEMKDKNYLKNELKTYNLEPEFHKNFIDRYNSLYYLRRNISISFFIVALINFALFFFLGNPKINLVQDSVFNSIFVFIGFIMYTGAVDARKKFFRRIRYINILLKYKQPYLKA